MAALESCHRGQIDLGKAVGAFFCAWTWLSRPASRQHTQDLAEALSDMLQPGQRLGRERNRALCLVGFCLRTQLLASPGDGEPLFVEQCLNAHHVLDIAPAI